MLSVNLAINAWAILSLCFVLPRGKWHIRRTVFDKVDLPEPTLKCSRNVLATLLSTMRNRFRNEPVKRFCRRNMDCS